MRVDAVEKRGRARVTAEGGVVEDTQAPDRPGLRAGHARRLAGDASDGVPADAREAYEKASAVARGAGLDELAARARNGAEGKAGAADMIDGG